MLNADDQETGISLRQLRGIVVAGTRPIVFWIGAGSSRWLGYPSWKDLALGLRKDFFRNVSGFDDQQAQKLISRGRFPTLFQACRNLDSPRYYRFLTQAFEPKVLTAHYRTFVDLLAKASGLFVLTTNVDEGLEKSLATSATVQRSDLWRCVDLVQRRVPFVAKLHGSISSVQDTVFADSDYESLIGNSSYLQALKYVFTSCTVVFLGYGVRDDYVVRLLQEDASEKNLFGPGPHFVVTNDAILRRVASAD